MSLNQTFKISGSGLQNIVNTVRFQIGNAATFIADKMVMRMGIRVKMIHTVSDAQPGNLTQIGKQCQITVNSSKTDVGKFCSYIAVYYICRRMVVSGHQEIFDGFPLTAVFQHTYRLLSLKTITVTVTIAEHMISVNMFIFFLEIYFSVLIYSFLFYGRITLTEKIARWRGVFLSFFTGKESI